MSGMIAYLSGTVELIHEGYAIIKTRDIGYKVFLPNRILSSFRESAPVTLYIHTHVRETALDLYGFASFKEQLLFEKMITISGIGPKIAIGIFQIGTVNEIVRAIQASDVDFFTQVPRFCKKNAQKVILELKNSFDDGEVFTDSQDKNSRSTVISALMGFGFSRSEASDALDKVKDPSLSMEEQIRKLLQILGK